MLKQKQIEQDHTVGIPTGPICRALLIHKNGCSKILIGWYIIHHCHLIVGNVSKSEDAANKPAMIVYSILVGIQWRKSPEARRRPTTRSL